MALSSYPNNWATLDKLNSEMTAPFHDRQLAEIKTEHLLPFDEDNLTLHHLANSFFADPFFNPDEFLNYSDDYDDYNYTNLLPFHENPPISLPPQIFPNFDPSPVSKRQKCCENLANPIPFDGFFPNSLPDSELFLPEIFTSLTELQNPQGNFVGNAENLSLKGKKEECLSAQSKAARQRRRKIAEKTQELGKLIPGGSKMNTAEMLQAAFKYVKYLQAFVGIFQSMGSIQEKKESTADMEDLQVLLQSSKMQEKLYSEEKCLVPIEFVKTLITKLDDRDSESNSFICNDLNRLIQSDDFHG